MCKTVEAIDFFGPQDFCLTPGKINAEAVHVYSNGQCHALALAINERTGWPIVGASPFGTDYPNHVAVKRPDGRIIDITGYVNFGYWGSEWYELDPGVVRNRFEDDDGPAYLEPNIEVARTFVDAVLAQVSEPAMFEVVGEYVEEAA